MPGRQPFCGKGEPALRAMCECCRGCPRGDSPGVASELRGAPTLTCPPSCAEYPPGEAGQQERKSVVSGKSVTVSADLGGRRLLKTTIDINDKQSKQQHKK